MDALLHLHSLIKSANNDKNDEEYSGRCMRIRRKDGDTVLHIAIAGECFDLAFQIIYLCRDLVTVVNENGDTPLHILATKASAFRSGSKFGPWKSLSYESGANPFKATRKANIEDNDSEDVLHERNEGNQVAPGDRVEEHQSVPENYLVCCSFARPFNMLILVVIGQGAWITKLLREKEKHRWSVKVLKELLTDPNLYKFEDPGKMPGSSEETLALELEKHEENQGDQKNETTPLNAARNERGKQEEKQGDQKEETALLIAARNGITEMVRSILENFSMAIYDENEDQKNVVLLAVENRRVEVYKLLVEKYSNNESVFRKVDAKVNSALHLAAMKGGEKPWSIPGDALQMQWEIKWNKFIENSVPPSFFVRFDNSGKTPGEIFTTEHNGLVESGCEWMKNTWEACSVVAALIATVAFATSTALPGGINESSGKPTLEHQPAFQVFAIASLVALCFSVTSLAMFLAILTSRFQEKDFGMALPWKLLLGLTSLFLSIAAMLVSFCAGHFFVLRDTLKYAAFPVYALTCVPVTFFAAAQFPLYIDLIRATFRSPFGKARPKPVSPIN